MSRTYVLAALLLFTVACTGTTEVVTTDIQSDMAGALDVAQEAAVSDAVAESTSLEEVFLPDLVLPDVPDVLPDFAPVEDAGPQCEAGEGCFLDPCLDNSDCLSGWCVEHLGEGVCTVACQEECPQGWSCQQVGIGPDVQYICVSKHANLCRPGGK